MYNSYIRPQLFIITLILAVPLKSPIKSKWKGWINAFFNAVFLDVFFIICTYYVIIIGVMFSLIMRKCNFRNNWHVCKKKYNVLCGIWPNWQDMARSTTKLVHLCVFTFTNTGFEYIYCFRIEALLASWKQLILFTLLLQKGQTDQIIW